jgi:hypothetical protein
MQINAEAAFLVASVLLLFSIEDPGFLQLLEATETCLPGRLRSRGIEAPIVSQSEELSRLLCGRRAERLDELAVLQWPERQAGTRSERILCLRFRWLRATWNACNRKMLLDPG